MAAVLATVASVREALAEGGEGCTLVSTGTLEEVVAGSSALRGVVRDTLHGGWGGAGGAACLSMRVQVVSHGAVVVVVKRH